jgi:hypothetical protein
MAFSRARRGNPDAVEHIVSLVGEGERVDELAREDAKEREQLNTFHPMTLAIGDEHAHEHDAQQGAHGHRWLERQIHWSLAGLLDV